VLTKLINLLLTLALNQKQIDNRQGSRNSYDFT